MEIDKKDIEVLKILEGDASLTTQQISKKTHIPITTIHNRIKKLKQMGIIKKFTIIKDYTKLGKPIVAYILITLNYPSSGKKVNQREIAKQLKSFEEVQTVAIVTGTTDIIIQVRVNTIDVLNDFIIDKLRNVDGIDKTQTLIVLKEI
ncbi:Lrp/AsnC family transcriptional regulator [Candidatus Woesearchaeota archaeon]|nr:Lrp/AsnC family transcriptional regulator [Candidatus Woesearchaeota archaeon]